MSQFPPHARQQPDGSVTFPARGRAPACNMVGYIQDPTDEYRWLMIYCECVHREIGREYICSRSNRLVKRDYCHKINMVVNPRYCNVDCNVPKVDRLQLTTDRLGTKTF